MGNIIFLMNRREFLKLASGGMFLLAGASLQGGSAMASLPKATGKLVSTPRTLTFYSTWTGEKAKATFWENGVFVPDSLHEFNRVLRDFRTGDVAEIDPKLFNMLYLTQKKLGCVGKEIHVISGYRSAASNEMLREKKRRSGVAKASYHTKGQAIDIRIPGTSLASIKKAVVTLHAGGVGFYPSSNFVHIDTGPVRKWG